MGEGNQLKLAIEEQPPWEVPLVYVASALSHLSPSERIVLRPWCDAVAEAVVDATREDTPPWYVRTHIPFAWSAPWSGDGREPAQIYEANMKFVRDAAALIVLGYRGGSLGSGQELGWACALRIPVLYLRPKGDALSRQIEGTPADISFKEFESTEELKEAVVRFVRSRRAAIEDHPRRLRGRAVMLAPLATAIQEAWSTRSKPERERAAGNARLHSASSRRVARRSVDACHGGPQRASRPDRGTRGRSLAHSVGWHSRPGKPPTGCAPYCCTRIRMGRRRDAGTVRRREVRDGPRGRAALPTRHR